jgi:uncharacterized membrane protein
MQRQERNVLLVARVETPMDLSTTRLELRLLADTALKRAARLWCAVAVIGQWAFVYYIVGFYGRTTLSGNFEAWSRNKLLPKGYVAGDTAGNLAFAAHVLLAAIVTLGGTLQLFPQIRDRARSFHRWNGRVFLVSAMATSVVGVYMITLGGRGRSVDGTIAAGLNFVLIVLFAALAWRSARAGDIAAHRRWALRTYLATNGVWFMRVGFMAWLLLNHRRGLSTFYRGWEFGCYLLPLAVFELYLRARDAGERLAVAAVLFVLTGLMGAGIFALYVGIFRPLLR